MKGKGVEGHKNAFKNIMAPRREASSLLISLWGFSGKQRVNLGGSSRDPEGASPARCQSRAGSREGTDPGKKSSGVSARAPGAFQELLLARLRQPIAPRAPKRGGERAIRERGRAKGEHFCKRSPR